MASLVNGAGCEVTAQMDADLYAGIFGDRKIILDVGQLMAAAIIDNNTVRVYDGEIISQGRRIHVNAGEYDDFTIENGTQGAERYDIIGYHIYKSDGNELCEMFVRKDAGEDGSVAEESLRDGADETYISLYKVKLNGLSIESVTALCSVLTSMNNGPYVVETGQNGSRNWIKYSNGEMLQWGKIALNEVEFTGTDGYLKYGSSRVVYFAENFVSDPVVTITMQHPSVAFFPAIEKTEKHGFWFWPYGTKAGSATNVVVNWQATGRWK